MIRPPRFISRSSSNACRARFDQRAVRRVAGKPSLAPEQSDLVQMLISGPICLRFCQLVHISTNQAVLNVCGTGASASDLKDVDGWLVDRADDSAPRVDGVANRSHDDGGSAGVEAAGRLVHENNRRVGDELYRDGEPLALLHTEPALPCKPSIASCNRSSCKQTYVLGANNPGSE